MRWDHNGSMHHIRQDLSRSPRHRSDHRKRSGALRVASCLARPLALLTLPLLLQGTSPVGAQPSGSPGAPFTVEQVLSSPHPSGMEAAPVGGHVAWVFNDRGTRNVWLASPPEFEGRPVTDFGNGERSPADDGEEIGSIAWSPRAARLAFVRGGPRNAAGELPNAFGFATGVERAIWTVDLATGEMTRIGPGSNPLWLDEETLLFVRDGALMRRAPKAPSQAGGEVDSAASGRSTEAGADDGRSNSDVEESKILTVRGGLSTLRLSPDRRSLAFVSSRGSHGFIGLLDLGVEGARVRYLDPSVDRDSSPVFSPDGSRLAFLRLPPMTAPEIFTPQREGAPWSIRVVDLGTGTGTGTGAAREIFRADPGPGSVFRGVVAEDQLVWTQDGHLIFPWERDGWTHLYSVPVARPAASREPVLLTPGEFEVEYVAATADGNGVVFSSNQGDIDRRHLWSVGGSGRPTAVTSGRGVENAPVPLRGGGVEGAIAFVAADGRRPLEPRVLLAGGSQRPLAPGSLPETFPLAQMIEPEQVIFPASDGMMIHGQLFVPEGAAPEGGRPGVLFLHGGSRRHMMLGWHYSSYYHNSYAFHQLLASRGFVVLSVNYRSGIGYGMEFREALDYGAAGGAELRDVLGAGLYLRSRDDIDPQRIGLWGGSYGGYLTAMGLTRASDLFAAGVDIHGVHDWNVTIKNFIPSYEPLRDPAFARLAFESSPMAQVEDWRSPVLLVHGDDDRNVPFSETVTLVEKLRELGVEHELMVLPDEVHSFLRHEHWVAIFERAADFFVRHLVANADARESERVAAP